MRYVLKWASITAALIFLGILCTLLLGLWRFNRLVRRDVEELLARATTTPEEPVVTEVMLRDLPEPVRRYLRYTGIVGQTVRAHGPPRANGGRCTSAPNGSAHPDRAKALRARASRSCATTSTT
jgi:hypothetical protein